MEELESRAQIKAEAQYTTDFIKQLDDKLLAGGGGARRDLTKYEKQEATGIAAEYPAGATPDEAWQTMVKKWKNGVTDSNLGVYTEITKLAYRDFENEGAAAQREYYEKWGTKSYEVKQNEDYAVISFGKKEGWDNAPFLYSRTDEGWKVDIVHQRRYIRMGNAPKWGVERGDFPHMELLSGLPYWMEQDIPFEEEDRYTIAKDKEWASEILRLEAQNKNNPDDFEILIGLARLNVLTSMRPNHYFPLLNKAKSINPEDPRPYKYLAIAHVNSNYQFQSAIAELREFLRREPDSVFGHSFLGYLYLQENDFQKAVDELEQALKLDPNNGYVLCKLSRAYGNLYLKSTALDPRRGFYKAKSNEMYEAARNAGDANPLRLKWLNHWLKEEGIK
ncbi:MAG TPA: tetratricopeptide repeat protein, partial [Candidatus Bathyarchaeia archaeon]|nr:tetratricopeptide repeat protein [Candidatus Bathyarchaeia archaeon]